MSATNAPDAAAPALRTEHDDLARRLAVRHSVDELRRGLVRLFLGLLAVGVAVKLGWDRWGAVRPGVLRKVHAGPPVFLWIATAVAIVVLLLAVRSLLASRRLSRDEDRLFARFVRLRAELGLDR